jgi:CCR4-NOT complex subunit CAF16
MVQVRLAQSAASDRIADTRAGKSTLLQILAGKRLTRAKAKVLGQAVFFNTPAGVTYLGAPVLFLSSALADDAAKAPSGR